MIIIKATAHIGHYRLHFLTGFFISDHTFTSPASSAAARKDDFG